MATTLWTSVATSLEEEAEAELKAKIRLSRPPKRMQGQILFAVDDAEYTPAELAAAVMSLR
eukprot:5707351-Pleurochrysis_carterae.AAC.2